MITVTAVHQHIHSIYLLAKYVFNFNPVLVYSKRQAYDIVVSVFLFPLHIIS
jgi:hypothetical protein